MRKYLKMSIRCMVISLACTFSFSVATAQTVAVNKDITSSLTSAKLKRVFTGKERTWSDGTPIVLIISPLESPEAKWLSDNVVGVPARVLKQILLKKAFQDKIAKPIFLKATQDPDEVIATTRGAIGVVASGKIVKSVAAKTE